MLLSITGLLILLTPFIISAIIRKKNISYWIVVFWFAIHPFVGGLLLYFKVFNIGNIILSHSIVYALCVFFLYQKGYFKKGGVGHVDIFSVIILLVGVFYFSYIHTNYTGNIIDINQNYTYVENHTIAHPSYSDEWVAIAYARDAAIHQKIPLHNPFEKNESFISFTFIYYIWLSEVLMLIPFDFVLSLVLLKIIISSVIVVVFYNFLKSLHISRTASFLTTLGIPFIINASAAPGLWYLVPFSLSVLFFAMASACLLGGSFRCSFVYAIMSFIYYPPSIIVFLLMYAAWFIVYGNLRFLDYKGAALSVGALVVSALAISLLISIGVQSTFYEVIQRAYAYIIRDNLLPDNLFYNATLVDVIPLGLFWVSIAGCFIALIKRSYFFVLIYVFFIILQYMYLHTEGITVVIDFVRITHISSIISIMAFAFLYDYIGEYIHLQGINIRKIYIVSVGGILFLVMTLLNLGTDNWYHIGYVNRDTNIMLATDPPVHDRYKKEEKDLFAILGDSRILTDRWRGLMYGATTDIIPLDVKAAFIWKRELTLKNFMKNDCNGKNVLAKKYNVAYIYGPSFECENFKKIPSDLNESLTVFEEGVM